MCMYYYILFVLLLLFYYDVIMYSGPLCTNIIQVYIAYSAWICSRIMITIIIICNNAISIIRIHIYSYINTYTHMCIYVWCICTVCRNDKSFFFFQLSLAKQQIRSILLLPNGISLECRNFPTISCMVKSFSYLFIVVGMPISWYMYIVCECVCVCLCMFRNLPSYQIIIIIIIAFVLWRRHSVRQLLCVLRTCGQAGDASTKCRMHETVQTDIVLRYPHINKYVHINIYIRMRQSRRNCLQFSVHIFYMDMQIGSSLVPRADSPRTSNAIFQVYSVQCFLIIKIAIIYVYIQWTFDILLPKLECMSAYKLVATSDIQP